MPQSDLTFAVPKGRLLDDALPVMERAGVVPEAGFHDKANRALCFATTRPDMRLIRVRAFDVATFVAHGAAQIGIVGSDVIEEFDYSDLYAPVDLDIGHTATSPSPSWRTMRARWTVKAMFAWRPNIPRSPASISSGTASRPSA